MTVSNPLLTRRAVLQCAIESGYRVPATVGVDDAIYVEDPDYSVDPNFLERNFARDDLSPLPNIVGRRQASIKFTTELKGNGKQHSGNVTDAPIISRLFRACGYSLTALGSADVSQVFPVGTHPSSVTWAATVGSHQTTIGYFIEVTTAGTSGVAQISISSDTAGESTSTPVTITSGADLSIGTTGLKLTPTFTGDLVLGQKWVVWLLPKGLRFDPVSDGFESLTLVLNMDGVEHHMYGSYGTFSVNAEAGDYAKIEWEFQGTYEDPTDKPLPQCNYETTIPAQVEHARLRIDKDYTIVNAWSFEQGNDIQIRPDVSSGEGYVGTRIVSREPKGGIDPEAELVSNHDFWGKLGRAERMSFQIRIGTEAGNTVWFLSPSVQYTGLTYQDRDGIRAYDAELKYSRVFGNDEICIIFT